MRQHLLPFKCNLLLLYINGLALATDALLWMRATPVVISSVGRPFVPLRYVQWGHSTPTMIFMLALLADVRGWKMWVAVISDVLMVVTGLAACYTAGWVKVAYTVTSFATFFLATYCVYRMFDRTLSSDSLPPEQRGTLRTVLGLLFGLWSAFPVVWLAADAHLIGPHAEAVAWGICDYMAKVVFSSQLWQSNLTGVQQRRDSALEAWESSNRAEAVARLTALLQQRDDLLSCLSHELRTPLAGIVALTGPLQKEVAAALPSGARTLAAVRATAACMLNIVATTLDSFAGCRRPTTRNGYSSCNGGLPIGPVAKEERAAIGDGSATVAARRVMAAAAPPPLDLRPLIDTVVSVLRPLAHDGVAVKYELPQEMPLVAADPTRMSQVLYNLVGNAMRFTSEGHVRVSARVIIPEDAGINSSPPAQPQPPPPPKLQPSQAPHRQRPHPLSPLRTVSNGGTRPGTAAAAAAAAAAVFNLGQDRKGRGRPVSRRLSISSASTTSSAAMAAAAAAALPPGSQVEVSVEDTGSGIPQEQLDQLLQRYRTTEGVASAAAAPGMYRQPGAQEHTHARAGAAIDAHVDVTYGGTGLGLYLVRLALQASGSDITAESAQGVGSVFRFRLQVASQPGAVDKPAHEQGQGRQDWATPAPELGPAPPQQAQRASMDLRGFELDSHTSVGEVPAAGLTEALPAGAPVSSAEIAREGGSSIAASGPLPLPPTQQHPADEQQRGQQQQHPQGGCCESCPPGGAPGCTRGVQSHPGAAGTGSPPAAPAPDLDPEVLSDDAAFAAQLLEGLIPSHRHRNGGTLQVLSVDDDPINQLVAGQMLTGQGWRVVKAMNGPAALAHFRISATDGDGATHGSNTGTAAAGAVWLPPPYIPDCVLLDVMMPGMTGFEVCRRLRQRFTSAQLPVIIVSAKGDAAAVEEAFASGADDYMTKPYKRGEMVARIKAQLRIRDSAVGRQADSESKDLPTATPSAAVRAGVEAGGKAAQHKHPPAVARALAAAAATSPGRGGGPASADAARLACQSGVGLLDSGSRSDPAAGTGAAGSGSARHGRSASTDAADLAPIASGQADMPTPVIAAAKAPGGPPSSRDPAGGSIEAGLNSLAMPSAAGDVIPESATVTDARPASGPSSRPAGPLSPPQRAPGPASASTAPETVATTAPATPPTTTSSATSDTLATSTGPPEVALLQEVLSEVRRGRALEAEVWRLQERLAALAGACGTLAADRDGWRRQAQELRALLASRLGAGGGAGAGLPGWTGPGYLTAPAHTVLYAASPAPAPMPNGSTYGYNGLVGGLHVAPAAPQGAPRGSGDLAVGAVGRDARANGHPGMTASNSTDSLTISGGAGRLCLQPQRSCSGDGAPSHNDGGQGVLAVLEDLKREAAVLRQQLSAALATGPAGWGGLIASMPAMPAREPPAALAGASTSAPASARGQSPRAGAGGSTEQPTDTERGNGGDGGGRQPIVWTAVHPNGLYSPETTHSGAGLPIFNGHGAAQAAATAGSVGPPMVAHIGGGLASDAACQPVHSSTALGPGPGVAAVTASAEAHTFEPLAGSHYREHLPGRGMSGGAGQQQHLLDAFSSGKAVDLQLAAITTPPPSSAPPATSTGPVSAIPAVHSACVRPQSDLGIFEGPPSSSRQVSLRGQGQMPSPKSDDLTGAVRVGAARQGFGAAASASPQQRAGSSLGPPGFLRLLCARGAVDQGAGAGPAPTPRKL